MGPYDRYFDRNKDGKMDYDEEMERQDFDDFINKRGIYEEDEPEEEYELDELDLAGLDREELELMDEEDRAAALEEAGFDPDDWEGL